MQGATYQKAQGICPAGWYVPTDEEWRTLEMAYGMTYAQATTDGAWRGSNQGTQFKVNGGKFTPAVPPFILPGFKFSGLSVPKHIERIQRKEAKVPILSYVGQRQITISMQKPLLL